MLNVQVPLVDLLRALVDIESVSGNEGRIADEIQATLAAAEHLRVERIGNAVVARTERGLPERVVIAGHVDTVPVANNIPSWVEGDRVYGRGTCDMKGGLAVQLQAAVQIAEPNRDVTWIFYDNEEVDAALNGLGRVARERPDLLAGSFAVLMEPTSARVEGGCQGTMRFVITTKGVAAHSARAWLGHNAIHDAADVLNRLGAWRPRSIVVDGLEYREGMNAVRIAGGVAGNVIPDSCRIEINYRFAPDKDADAATGVVRQTFPGYELEILDLSPGARPGLDQPAAARFVAAVGGVPSPKYGWTDVARFSELGVPAVNFGPADPGKAHADDEFCPIDQLQICAEALRRWLEVPA